MTATTLASYRIKGTTGDITTCDHCGREGLRKTVILATLDADGAEQEILHFGVDCAARAARRTQPAIRNAATAADSERAEAVALAEHTIATYGPVEGDLRATAELFFTRNPHARGRIRASAWVAKALADARAVLAQN